MYLLIKIIQLLHLKCYEMFVFTKLNNLQLNKISKYLKQLSIVSNMFAPVPILQIGISTNRVTALAISGLNTLTSIASVFSPPWSLLSSVSNENVWF